MDTQNDLKFISFDKKQILYIDALPEVIEFDAEQQNFLIGFSHATYQLLDRLGPGFIRISKWSNCDFSATDSSRKTGCLMALWNLINPWSRPESDDKELPPKYSQSSFRDEQDEIAPVEIGFDLVGDEQTILGIPLRDPEDTFLVQCFKTVNGQ